MKPKPPVLRWKKDKPETGLRRIGARPPSHDLRSSDGRRCATASPLDREGALWFWVTGWDFHGEIPYANTCATGVPLEQAKAEAKAFCQKHLTPKP